MPNYVQSALRNHLSACDRATTAAAKGRTLEDMCRFLFDPVPGFMFIGKNILDVRRAHELDLAFSNNSPLLAGPLGTPVFLECKNHKRTAGSAHVAWFATKLRARAAHAGVLVSLSGISGINSGTAGACEIVETMLTGVRIVTLDRSEIAALRSTSDLEAVLVKKFNHLAMRREVV